MRFGKTTKKDLNPPIEQEEETKKGQAQKAIAPIKEDLSWVIINPRITEKTAFLTGVQGYTFNISPLANKTQVNKAIKEIYRIDPVKIRIVNRASRKTISRGRKVHKAGSKKAIVYLKKGDKIEFV